MAVAVYREDGLSSSTAIKGPCRVATTADIALSGLPTIDGVATAVNDRVLVRAQADPTKNGIYIADTGTWRRSADFSGNRDVRKGTRVSVTDGSTYAQTEFQVTSSNPVVVDEDAITFSLGEVFLALLQVQALAAQVALDKAAAEAAQAAAEAAAIAAGQGNPTGLCGQFGGPTPTGWLDCDGSEQLIASYPDLFAYLVTDAPFTAQSFTVTIATPGVVTRASHGFNGTERLRLFTTGSLPTGLDTTSDFFVVPIDTDTFYLADQPFGDPIETSGSQSGTHTYFQSYWGLGDGSTTFNVPFLDDSFVRGAGMAREIGTQQLEDIGPHLHGGTTDPDGGHGHPTRVSTANGQTTNNNGGMALETSGDTNYPAYNSATPGSSAGQQVGAVADHTHTFETDDNDGTENRPANTALRWAIKA